MEQKTLLHSLQYENKLRKLQKQLKHSSYRCEVNESDYCAFEPHKQQLLQQSLISNRFVAIFDVNKWEYMLFQGQLRLTKEYTPHPTPAMASVAFRKSLLSTHTLFMLDSLALATKFMTDMTEEQKKEYLLVFDYRYCDALGINLRFTQRTEVLRTDSNGNIWLVKMEIELMPGNVTDSPPQRWLKHRKSNTYQLFTDNKLPTPTEIEVLRRIMMGQYSKKISKELFICKCTVDKHRQNIIGKTYTTDTLQAIHLMRQIELI